MNRTGVSAEISPVEVLYAHRLSAKSALLPTSTTITSFPLSDLTSSIHLDVDRKEARSWESSSLGCSDCDSLVSAYW